MPGIRISRRRTQTPAGQALRDAERTLRLREARNHMVTVPAYGPANWYWSDWAEEYPNRVFAAGLLNPLPRREAPRPTVEQQLEAALPPTPEPPPAEERRPRSVRYIGTE